jgi:hypothetical protein
MKGLRPFVFVQQGAGMDVKHLNNTIMFVELAQVDNADDFFKKTLEMNAKEQDIFEITNPPFEDIILQKVEPLTPDERTTICLLMAAQNDEL